MKQGALVLSLGCVLWCAGQAEVSATTITYEAVDLADATVGEDLWEYRYVVSDRTFLADEGYTVLFDPFLYAGLEDPPPGRPGWDIITLQPDPGLISEGIYDALALVDSAPLTDAFVVSFFWLGPAGTRPGAQAFSVYHLDPSGVPTVLEDGRTVSATAVPEPSALLLTVLVVVEAAWRRHGRASRQLLRN